MSFLWKLISIYSYDGVSFPCPYRFISAVVLSWSRIRRKCEIYLLLSWLSAVSFSAGRWARGSKHTLSLNKRPNNHIWLSDLFPVDVPIKLTRKADYALKRGRGRGTRPFVDEFLHDCGYVGWYKIFGAKNEKAILGRLALPCESFFFLAFVISGIVTQLIATQSVCKRWSVAELISLPGLLSVRAPRLIQQVVLQRQNCGLGALWTDALDATLNVWKAVHVIERKMLGWMSSFTSTLEWCKNRWTYQNFSPAFFSDFKLR